MFSEDKVALKRYKVYHGVADLYTYFVELGNTYLKDGGHFGFITPNKFVRANYGAPLRKFLIEQVRLERLVNFSDLPVFQEATTYPMIMLTSKQPADEAHVKYTLLKQLHPDNIADDIKNGESLVHPSALTEQHWHLNGTNIQTGC
jgi:type II restriction/modification system DNA methylase subunit YeeA